DERLKRLKSEQESKLDETKKSPEKTQDPVSISKRSSSQKILNLSPTQRLDNLIQASTNDLVAEDNELKRNTTGLPRPPPIPPRQVKPDDKTTTTKSPSPPPPPLVLVKPSNPTIFSSNNTNNMNTPKDSFNENNDQDLLIQMSPPKTSNVPIKSSISPLTGKVNSPFNRYTLANSQSPYVLKETYFYTESTTVNSNSTNNQNSLNSPAPVIVTRTLSTSNVRNASATIVQTTPSNSQISASSSIPLPNLYPRSSNRSLTSPSVGAIPSYHPITTEL
ncbi:unnamed protein product, partial [Rotaria magnacalcarata]